MTASPLPAPALVRSGPADPLPLALRSERPLDLRSTLAKLARGPYDPTFRVVPGGPHAGTWRTSLFPTGPVTYRLVQAGVRDVVGQAWGPGAGELAASLPSLLGEPDDAASFEPPARLADAHRRHPGLRVPRTGRVLEALVPAVLEQKVQTVTAHHAWRWLLARYGTPAPGPAPAGMRVVPDARTWVMIPTWDWHRAGVDPRRARTVVECARVARRLEECAAMDPASARARLQLVPGVGVWTAAEVAQRALGDADAVSVGDFHLAKAVGWALTGERTDDAGMLALLAPYAPHRYRVVRLLEVSGLGHAPRRGPRLSIQDHRHN